MVERPGGSVVNKRIVRFVAAERSDDDLAYVEPTLSFAAGDSGPDLAALAKHYLVRVLELDAGADLSFDGSAAPAPEVALAGVQDSKLSATSVVRFTQARAQVPIFGSHMVVELDAAGKLVGVDAELAAVQGVDATPTLDPEQAGARIAALVGAAPGSLELAAPVLHYYHHEDDDDGADRWHLVWL